jgi:hypothetical protein
MRSLCSPVILPVAQPATDERLEIARPADTGREQQSHSQGSVASSLA